MSIETKKLRLIEDFIKVTDLALLDKIEAILAPKSLPAKRSIDKFAGIWSREEADEMRKIITEGCEQINEEDWH